MLTLILEKLRENGFQLFQVPNSIPTDLLLRKRVFFHKVNSCPAKLLRLAAIKG
jgi:hypothetical protein